MSDTELALAALLAKINFKLDLILEQAGRDLEKMARSVGQRTRNRGGTIFL
jgi:hypothetical protein